MALRVKKKVPGLTVEELKVEELKAQQMSAAQARGSCHGTISPSKHWR